MHQGLPHGGSVVPFESKSTDLPSILLFDVSPADVIKSKLINRDWRNLLSFNRVKFTGIPNKEIIRG